MSRGQEWVSQGEDISHKSTPAASLCGYLIPSHQSAGEEDQGGLALSSASGKSGLVATSYLKMLGKLACSKYLKGPVGSMVDAPLFSPFTLYYRTIIIHN